MNISSVNLADSGPCGKPEKYGRTAPHSYAEAAVAAIGKATEADTNMGGFEIVVQRSFEDLAPLRSQWDALTAELGGSIYMSFDWTRTWWQFYGSGKELRVFVCYANGILASILPMYIDRIGLPPLRLSVARLVGSNIPPKTFDPPVRRDCAERIFEFALAQLAERDGCDAISLGPMSETCRFLDGFERVCRKPAGPCGDVVRERAGVHTLFHLPGSLDEFFAGMDKDERKKRKYEMRLLAREEGVVRDVVRAPDQVEAEFEAFASLHALQWRDKGKLGHFGSWPRGRQYNLALVRAMASLGRVRFVRILLGGEVISSQLAFVFGDCWFWELPARLTDRKWNRFSLGTTGFFCLVEEAMKEGKTRIEGGIAHYDYKQKLGGTEYALEVLRIVANRFGSKVRTRFFRCVRRCVEVVYYKIWYARVSPRLPAPLRRPIWSFWLRLDF
jgi:CelD/BcsL family acetyltransferase involved in cellulose biosynthesis